MIQITFDGRRRRAEVPGGATLLEAALSAGIPLRWACRHAECGTCLLRVTGAGLEPPAADERRLLDRLGAAADRRLACQARLKPAAELTLDRDPPES